MQRKHKIILILGTVLCLIVGLYIYKVKIDVAQPEDEDVTLLYEVHESPGYNEITESFNPYLINSDLDLHNNLNYQASSKPEALEETVDNIIQSKIDNQKLFREEAILKIVNKLLEVSYAYPCVSYANTEADAILNHAESNISTSLQTPESQNPVEDRSAQFHSDASVSAQEADKIASYKFTSVPVVSNDISQYFTNPDSLVILILEPNCPTSQRLSRAVTREITTNNLPLTIAYIPYTSLSATAEYIASVGLVIATQYPEHFVHFDNFINSRMVDEDLLEEYLIRQNIKINQVDLDLAKQKLKEVNALMSDLEFEEIPALVIKKQIFMGDFSYTKIKSLLHEAASKSNESASDILSEPTPNTHDQGLETNDHNIDLDNSQA